MTPHLWLLVYISVVLVLGAIAIGWTDGVWRRHQDEREARRLFWNAWREEVYRRLMHGDGSGEARGILRPEPPRRRSFKHQNLRSALARRAQIERGDR